MRGRDLNAKPAKTAKVGTRRRFIYDAAKGLIVPFVAGPLVRAASIVPVNPARFAVAGSGAFTPVSLTGKKVWFKGDDLTTLFKDAARTNPVTTGTDVINGITDKSGAGNHATTATTGAQGTYQSGIKNSKGVIRFGGATQFGLSGIAATTCTIWAVLANASNTTGYGTVFAETAANKGLFVKITGGVGYVLDNYSSSDHDSANITVSNWSTWLSKYDGAAHVDAYLNGAQFLTAAANWSSITFAVLGGHGSEFFTGDLAELVMVDHVSSGTEDTNMATYLTGEWGSTP